MKKHIIMSSLAALVATSCSTGNNVQQPEISLAEAYADYWYTGVSVNQWEVEADTTGVNVHGVTGQVSNDQTANWDVITKNFNWLVAENCMKCEVVHPQRDVYDFRLADQFVDKAKAAGKKVLGHCLIWHSQCAPWFGVDDEGNDVSPDTLRARMKSHITTVMTHFKGRVDAWDVCNECFEDDGSFRQSFFYKILGEEYIPLAFQYAHEADPDVELYYNDFSMNKPSKVESVVAFFKPLVENGLPITAIGMQGHMILEDGDRLVRQYNHSIETIASIGLPTFFSEVDMSVLPNPYGFSGANVSDRFKYRPEMDPFKDGMSAEKQQQLEDFWVSFYKMLIDHKDNIKRISFWCFNDANSWRNDFPIPGRTDYATLYNRDNQPKPFVKKLIQLKQTYNQQ